MLDPTEITQSAHRLHFGWPWEVKGQGHNRAGDGDRYVGIYTSPDIWRNCFVNSCGE